MKSSRKRKHW